MVQQANWKLMSIIAVGVILLLNIILGFYWDFEPEPFSVREITDSKTTGVASTKTLIKISQVMLEKPGGFLSNDILPPSVFMDNIPSWEYGVLTQVRDFSRTLRNDFSRSQSQSMENEDLKFAEPRFSYDRLRWFPPSAESSYEKGIEGLQSYLGALVAADQQESQFYARADNLREWLKIVEKRLGGLSQRLTASVGQDRENTDLAGEADATQSTVSSEQFRVKTAWMQIDNNFYEARGTCWALIHLLKAIEIDFNDALAKKNALASLRQIIRELEATQESVWSPMILNGSGFGFLANHSLVMASYISRANAGVIDLRALLSKG
jgi:hypothetical protein